MPLSQLALLKKSPLVGVVCSFQFDYRLKLFQTTTEEALEVARLRMLSVSPSFRPSLTFFSLPGRPARPSSRSLLLLIHIRKPLSTYGLSFSPLLYLYLHLNIQSPAGYHLMKNYTRLRRYRELNYPLRGKLRPQ